MTTIASSAAPPSIGEALGGTSCQLALAAYVYMTYTSLRECSPDPRVAACIDDPWARQVLITLAIALTLWLYALRTLPTRGHSDPSAVDKIFSTLPWLYVVGWYAAMPSPRLLLMAVLAAAWGNRLTYNFWVKGGYTPGAIDHRWAEMRSWPGFARWWELVVLIA